MSSFIGKLCPYCQQPIADRDEVLVCKQCRVPHHHRCWVEHQGCAVAGCSGAFGDAEPAPAGENRNIRYSEAGGDEQEGPPVTRYCLKCGSEIPEGAAACLSCGAMPPGGEDGKKTLPVFQTIIDGFNFAFECFERKGWFIILLQLGIIAAGCLLALPVMILLGLLTAVGGPVLVIPFVFGLSVLGAFIHIGVTIIYLKIADREEVRVNDLFSGGKYLLSFIGASLLVALGTMAGFVFLIIPGLAFMLFSFFYQLAVIDRGCGAVESIQVSVRLVLDNFLLAFALFVVALILNALGAMFFGLGALLTAPISVLVEIYCFRKMLLGRW